MAEYDNMSKYKCPKCRCTMTLVGQELHCRCEFVVDYKLYRLIRDIVEMAVERLDEKIRRITSNDTRTD